MNDDPRRDVRHYRSVDEEWKRIVWELLTQVQADLRELERMVSDSGGAQAHAALDERIKEMRKAIDKVEATARRNELDVRELMTAARLQGAAAGALASLVLTLLALAGRWLLTTQGG